MDHRVKKVIALMEEYLHRGWPASRFARFVNISPSRLHQLFKDETGWPPGKYLHSLRMRQAKELLETSFLTIKEVMAKVGVADESHFVRDFKKVYGVTPAKYREQFMSGDVEEEEIEDPGMTRPPPAQGTVPLTNHAPAESNASLKTALSPQPCLPEEESANEL
jgi:AraC-like DNA-binding protein